MFNAALYMKTRRIKRRTSLKLLLGDQCKNCGENNKLEFDHINPETKSFEINGSFLDKPWNLLIEETRKCQLLCNSCHKLKNKIDNGEAKHGGLTMYTYHKCRCDLCKTYWNKKTKEYKSKKHSRLA